MTDIRIIQEVNINSIDPNTVINPIAALPSNAKEVYGNKCKELEKLTAILSNDPISGVAIPTVKNHEE